MFARRALIPLAITLLAVGCSDERHPTSVSPSPTPHVLRWAGSGVTRFIAPNGGLQPSLSDRPLRRFPIV